MGNTKVDLVKDLQPYLKKFENQSVKKKKLFALMERAQQGYYHDFDTPLAAPKMQLHQDLLELGLTVQDRKMQNGDYDDETPTKEQSKELDDILRDEILKKKGGD